MYKKPSPAEQIAEYLASQRDKIEENKQRFIEVYKANITRKGTDKLLEWLQGESSDFFTAPASTRYHGAYAGGLCEHSVNVYECMKDYLSRERVKEQYGLNFTDESIALVALLHDLCKINLYKLYMKNVKNDETGDWESVPAYQIDEQMPFGHGEKSVYIINGFTRLTRDEAMAVRWHMGFSGDEAMSMAGKTNIGNALEKYPLALAAHIADMEATFLVEGKK